MLQKIVFKPGVNRENTRYTNEGGWYESDKVRFRQGTPEKIGGWAPYSTNTFQGTCRSLWNWVTLGSQNLIGLGTNLKFYIQNDGVYYDVTPLRKTSTLTNPFTTSTSTNSGGKTVVTVTDTAHGALNNDFVTFYGASTFNGVTVSGEYQIAYVNSNSYTISVTGTASASSSGGGTPVYAVYQINTGPSTFVPISGWGSGTWNSGSWGSSASSSDPIRIWSQMNFGQDLVFGPKGSSLYYWSASLGYSATTVSITNATPAVVTATITVTEGYPITFGTTGSLPSPLIPGQTYYARNVVGTSFNLSSTATGALINTSTAGSGTHSISPRGVLVSSLTGANQVPLYQNYLTISDVSRFVIVFGTNNSTDTILDPMLIRWSDQESVTNWEPTATTQAGSVRLSHGSRIVSTVQTRQEIVVFTDSSLYSLQYLGPPYIWGTQLLGDNISIVSSNVALIASGVVYWMGKDKFYLYNGRVETLNCDLRKYIFNDINLQQADQFFAGTSEGFNEVWWFYCSITGPNGTGTPSNPNTTIDKYVVYNYLENVWYYGNMARTAWLDSGLQNYPIAASYYNNLLNHESGVDDNVTGTPAPMDASISSCEFDIGDGDSVGFVWRMLPDISFQGSSSSVTPQVEMTLYPMQNSGSGTQNSSTQSVVSGSTYVVPETFTGQIYTRVRGRQLIFKVRSSTLGTAWQLGAPRIDIRPDGLR
jgi:hypothetical protein